MPVTVIESEWRDLSDEQRDVLVALAIAGPTTGARLHGAVRADAEPQTEGTTQRALRVLAERGYVERIPHTEDDRAVSNRVTAEGFDLLDRAIIQAGEAISVPARVRRA